MINTTKQLSNPISTSGAGIHFENRVQTSLVLLMLANGYAPCLPNWPIFKIKLQGKYQGYDTDDFIVYTKQLDSEKQAKLLGQIKHSINITNSNESFKDVIIAAWSDFNNNNLFNEDIDIIALICGPLSSTDTNGVRKLIDCAVHAEDSADFIDRIEKENFTSEDQRNKFEVFKTHLKTANKSNDLTNEQLWRFLKVFRLLIYDLDMKGVTLSLLHTIIGQYKPNNPNSIWTQILDIVQWESGQAGCITRSTIPEEIQSVFKKPSIEVIPPDLVKDSSIIIERNWNTHPNANELAIMCLIGSWNENSEYDRNIVCKLSHLDNIWISRLRELLQLSESPLILKNGNWSLKDRKKLFETLGARIFDNHLDSFKDAVIMVLRESDPKFELAIEDRFAAPLYGKTYSSQSLRKGLAEGLALIGNYSSYLINCSLNKPEHTIVLSIREIFNNSDWILWASLNDLLPIIAESAPDEFINSIDSALLKLPCPFDELFAQESNGFIGANYMTGLLWALEALAWEEQFIVRVTVILGELAKRDTGGSWANRPFNSIVTIFLPWFPQTFATFEKRKTAILTLKKEFPEITWKLLINLLPNKHQTSSETYKPIWRNSIPKDWRKEVLNNEYWEQINFYAENVLELAKDNIHKLNEFVNNLDNLPINSFELFLQYLSSDSLKLKQEEEKYELWSKLIDFISKHKRFSKQKWALSPELVNKIELVANNFMPNNPLNLYRRLFNGRDDDLADEKIDRQTLQKQLDNDRQIALKAILEFKGLEGIFALIESVESPTDVGYTLGSLEEYSFDNQFFPNLLLTENKKIEQFISDYIRSKHKSCGWIWVDSIDISQFTKSQIARFYISLPFNMETWKRVFILLSDSEYEYWSKVSIYPHIEASSLIYAVDKLIDYGRPYAAINCIYSSIYDKQPIDKGKIVKALISAITTKESSYAGVTYKIIELIKFLQNDTTVDLNDLFHIEWAYLPILNKNNNVTPKLLEKQLATDSDFFCELIQLIYRSKNSPEKIKDTTEQEKSKALNAWRLLNEWHTPPGMQEGKFINDNFISWLKVTNEKTSKSGHLDVAQSHIGKVLFYCPADNSGFWINEVVATELNKLESQTLREGFCSEIFNSRGAHIVDPTGKNEKEIANHWKLRASETEDKGYQRLAASLINLAKSYDREAERIIDENNLE